MVADEGLAQRRFASTFLADEPIQPVANLERNALDVLGQERQELPGIGRLGRIEDVLVPCLRFFEALRGAQHAGDQRRGMEEDFPEVNAVGAAEVEMIGKGKGILV